MVDAQSSKINGLTVVGVPSAYTANPIPRLKQTHANWICLVPYGFGKIGSTDIKYNLDWQWWGEKREGIIETIRLAKAQNLKVLLKPQIYFHGSWPGDLDFKTENEWQNWEASYKKFITFFLEIAECENLEMFCIGTEFKQSVTKRNDFWVHLIKEARKIYTGEITYSSNWDHFNTIDFWNELDYIGISAYYPLVDKKTAAVNDIVKAWKPTLKKLKKVSDKTGKSILFTEYGYLSVDGCTYENWNLEKRINSLNVNQQAQADAFDALYKVFSDQDFWAGGFIWKWFPNNQGHEGYIDKDYTPQDKLAEKVIADWFKKMQAH